MEQIASVRAAEARRSLGVSASEPVDVIKLLREYRDISFVLRRFVSDISGMFIRADMAEVIAINTARSWGRRFCSPPPHARRWNWRARRGLRLLSR